MFFSKIKMMKTVAKYLGKANFEFVKKSLFTRKCVGVVEMCWIFIKKNRKKVNTSLFPVSAHSANSIQGIFSLVQKAKGIVQASCKHKTLTPALAAASIIVSMRA